MHFRDVLNMPLRISRSAGDGHVADPSLGSWIHLKEDVDLLPRGILLLFFADRGAVVAVLLHEQLNVGQCALDLVGRKQVSQLKLGSVYHLSGGGPVRHAFHFYIANKVIRSSKKR